MRLDKLDYDKYCNGYNDNGLVKKMRMKIVTVKLARRVPGCRVHIVDAGVVTL